MRNVGRQESNEDWQIRHLRLQLADTVSLFPWPFRARPTRSQWAGLVEAMLHLQRHEGLELVVIDPLTVFFPGNSENTAGAVMECLLPLRDLTSAGLAVLLVHHPRKGATLPGQSARGSGALPSHVDIVTEMTWYGKGDQVDRRRWLRSYSRYDETLRNLIVELNAEGTDYLGHEAGSEEASPESWHVLSMVLEDAVERLTQRQILEQWPEDFHKPDMGTISRTLKRGLEEGKIRQRGSGRKNDPYVYWLPEKEDGFDPGPRPSPEAWERFRRYHDAKALEIFGVKPRKAPEAASEPEGTRVPAAPPESAASQSPSDAAAAALRAEEAPAANTTSPTMNNPEPEPLPAAPQPEPAASPARSLTGEPRRRKRSRPKPAAKASPLPETGQESKPLAPATPVAEPPVPAPPPPCRPEVPSPAAPIAPMPDSAPKLDERIRLRMWPR